MNTAQNILRKFRHTNCCPKTRYILIYIMRMIGYICYANLTLCVKFRRSKNYKTIEAFTGTAKGYGNTLETELNMVTNCGDGEGNNFREQEPDFNDI